MKQRKVSLCIKCLSAHLKWNDSGKVCASAYFTRDLQILMTAETIVTLEEARFLI